MDTTDDKALPTAEAGAPTKPALTPEARRALEEAEARRRLASAPAGAQHEIGGPKGPEPTRYGDWEKAGITSDF